jgi:membrane-associated PAP2 superfamily phosphatase
VIYSDDVLLKRLTIIIVLSIGLLVLSEQTEFDVWIMTFVYDPNISGFPFKGNWWLKDFLHDGGRRGIFTVALICLIWLIISLVWRPSRKYRVPSALLLISMIFTTASVATIKYSSDIHCPYDLLEYGGRYQRTGLVEYATASQTSGRCWPGGHASAGFCLWAFYFVGLIYWRRWIQWAFWIPLFVGIFFGSVQILRGAHFFTHTLWTGLLVWSINVFLFTFVALISDRRTLNLRTANCDKS